MARLAQLERQALCDTFLAVGPDAPTLCEGWATRDLAAHLIVREARPDAAIGIFVPALAGRTDTVMASIASKPWQQVVGMVRSGPPRLSPMRLGLIDDATNIGEFFIHHEDVLRAADPSARRDLSAAHQRALWPVLRQLARMGLRKVPVGVQARSDGFGTAPLRPAPAGAGTVTLVGAPEELLLAVSGRNASDARLADVEIEGDTDAVAAYTAATSGL